MLEAQNISFSYPQGRQILHDVTLSVSPTDRWQVQAPSGTGKTTLCKILAGYLQPTEGCVRVDGNPLARRGVCPVQLIGQHPELTLDPRMRMQESLREASTQIDWELLERLGIRVAWMTRFPHELSGGELQRFCIARALMAQPAYLVADEISTMLDAVTQAQIWQVIREEVRERQMGLVFTTHSPALARCLEPTQVLVLPQEA